MQNTYFPMAMLLIWQKKFGKLKKYYKIHAINKQLQDVKIKIWTKWARSRVVKIIIKCQESRRKFHLVSRQLSCQFLCPIMQHPTISPYCTRVTCILSNYRFSPTFHSRHTKCDFSKCITLNRHHLCSFDIYNKFLLRWHSK